MTEETAFLNRIAESPEDTVTRLIYADWLDEHDMAEQAKYLRIEAQWEVPSKPEVTDAAWAKRFPVPEEVYPTVFRTLTAFAKLLDENWLASTSRLRHHCRQLYDRLRTRIPFGYRGMPGPYIPLETRRKRDTEILRREFERYLGLQATESRFAIPIDFICYTIGLGCGIHIQDKYATNYFKYLWDLSDAVGQTCMDYDENAEEQMRVNGSLGHFGLWLLVAWKGECGVYLCCDLESPYYGMVVHPHVHPWIDRTSGSTTLNVIARSYFDLILRFVTKAEAELPLLPVFEPER